MKFGLNTPKKSPSFSSLSSSNDSGRSNTWLWIFAVIIILIIVSFGCWTMTDSFTNFKTKFMKTESLKDMDVIMFMSPKCGYCQNMLAVLKDKRNDLRIIDITTDSGKKIAKEYGADNQPVPSFISVKYRTGWVGSLPTTEELIKKLSINKSSGQKNTEVPSEKSPSDKVDDMKILMFSRDGCPHCINAKMKLEESGLLNSVAVFDVTTKKGQEKIKELGIEIKGVPTFYSLKNKKMISGFKSIDSMLGELN